MKPSVRFNLPLVVAVAAGLVAVVVAAAIVRPLGGAGVGSDAASSVLYFQRIVAGERLERFLGTTPKPLMTLLYGAAYALTSDWRPVAWLAILAYGGAVGASTLLVGRVAGGVAAAFAATGLIASIRLFQDVSLAYSVSWALLAVAIVGLLVTADRPRWALAGLALAAGALARQEVFLLIAVAPLAGTIGAAVEWRRTGRAHLPASWPLLIALVAVPITGLHDWLLAGDPTYFLAVPAIGADGRNLTSVATAVRAVLRDLAGAPGLGLLALVGAAALVRRRSWPMIVGLAVFGPGMAVFFLWVAARGFVVLDRYLAPLDVAVVIAAAVGVGALAEGVRARLGSRLGSRLDSRLGSRLVAYGAVLAAGLAPLLLSTSIGPLDHDLRVRIRGGREAAQDWQAMLPMIRVAVADAPAIGQPVPPVDPRSKALARPALLVSAGLLPQAAVDLHLHLDRLGRLEWFGATPAELAGAEGSLIYVDAFLSASYMDVTWLVVPGPKLVGDAVLAPIGGVGDRVHLLRVDPPAGPPAAP